MVGRSSSVLFFWPFTCSQIGFGNDTHATESRGTNCECFPHCESRLCRTYLHTRFFLLLLGQPAVDTVFLTVTFDLLTWHIQRQWRGQGRRRFRDYRGLNPFLALSQHRLINVRRSWNIAFVSAQVSPTPPDTV